MPLTLTSAFMWPDSKTNLRNRSMLINEPPRTDAKTISAQRQKWLGQLISVSLVFHTAFEFRLKME